MKIVNRKSNTLGGYTIIETMISVSIFIIIVVAGIGALLNANLAHSKSADLRSILDNLTFIMEDMSRHARTGYNYRCYSEAVPFVSENPPNAILNTPQSCLTDGKTIVFEEAYGVPQNGTGPNVNDQWVYLIGAEAGEFNIYKSIDGGVNFLRLNSSSVKIDPDSSFFVRGAEKPEISLQSGNLEQPMVTMRLKGHIQYKNTQTPFSLQTSVTQRLIDVTP